MLGLSIGVENRLYNEEVIGRLRGKSWWWRKGYNRRVTNLHVAKDLSYLKKG